MAGRLTFAVFFGAVVHGSAASKHAKGAASAALQPSFEPPSVASLFGHAKGHAKSATSAAPQPSIGKRLVSPSFDEAILDTSYDSLDCKTVRNHAPLTNFSHFCPKGSHGCWPAVYLLGVQKAATTSIIDALFRCGLVSGGLKGNPKEGLQETDANITEHSGMLKYMGTHDMHECVRGTRTPKPFQYTLEACRAGRFIDGTPAAMGSPTVGQLLQIMPSPLAAQARFAIILREPVARLLSWYNHVIIQHAYYDDPTSWFTSFDHYVRTVRGTNDPSWALGRYYDAIREFGRAKDVKRSQLLVLNFDDLIGDIKTAMQRLTTHYGLPEVLTGMSTLPEDNTNDGPAKLIQVKCSTVRYAALGYKDDNELLYKALLHDHSKGKVPPTEPSFSKFDASKVPCGGVERSMGALSEAELMDYFQRARGRPMKAKEASLLQQPPAAGGPMA